MVLWAIAKAVLEDRPVFYPGGTYPSRDAKKYCTTTCHVITASHEVASHLINLRSPGNFFRLRLRRTGQDPSSSLSLGI